MVRPTMRELQAQIQELREQNERVQALLEAQSQATGILQDLQEEQYETAMEEGEGEEEAISAQQQTQVRNSKVPKVPNKLPKFSGKEGESVPTWILQMELACQIYGHEIKDSNTILPNIAGTVMESPADGFFLRWVTTTPKVKRTWKNFKDSVRNHFEGAAFQSILRKRLQNLSQKNSIEEYNNEFLQIIQQVESMSEVDKITYYTDGLKPRMKGEIRYKNPSDLMEAMDIAVLFDRAYFPEMKSSESKINSSKPQGKIFKSSKKVSSPYFNKDKIKVQNKNDKKNFTKSDITCHYCKKKGHKQAECYKRKNDEKKNGDQTFKTEQGNDQPRRE